MRGPNYTRGEDRFPEASGTYDESTIPKVRKTPLVLYGIFTEVARSFYSSGMLGDKFPVWNATEEQSEIWIDQQQAWEDKSPQFRPAIYVSLSPLEVSTDAGLKSTGLSGMRTEEAEYHFQQRCEGQAVWTHIGKTRSESLLLCETTFEMLSAFQMPIRKEFCFDRFSVVEFNPTKVDKEARESFNSAVAVNFSFQETWTLKLESAKLKKIVVDMAERIGKL